MEQFRFQVLARSQSQPQNVQATYLFTLIIPQIHSTYLLDAKAIIPTDALCRASVAPQSAHMRFSRWFRSQEVYQIPEEITTEQLCRCYDASRLQRSFLRYITMKYNSNCVVAGSFPGSHHLRRSNISSFPPNDVDIFVSSIEICREIRKHYTTLVLEPLQMKWYIESDVGSYIDVQNLSNDEEVFIADTTDSEHTSSTTANWQMNPLQMKRRIQKDIERFIRNNMGQQKVATHVRWQRELRKTTDFIPTSLSRPSYIIEASWHIHTKTKLKAPFVPLPLNIVWVQVQDETSDFSKVVCSGFDLKHCSIYLRVTSELHFQACEGSPQALECLEQKKLRLNPSVFSQVGCDTNRTIVRVCKYMRRGFAW